ncbi:MAG TPA: homocysteine S-methyltransferase [Woeseiaceae bacterium]|nr:homocysteine S-methyltransferase [Woeseiaceae bacterium]
MGIRLDGMKLAYTSTAFSKALERRSPIVLDGGLATQLETQGHDLGSALWSAALLRSNPQAIALAHRAFLEAGAECIISASYQASRSGFMSLGLSATAADRLIASAVEIAIAARDAFLLEHPDTESAPLVAASIGPYGAVLHDGSEYRGDYGIDREALHAFHEPRLRLLDGCGADVLACETIPDRIEADVLAELLETTNTPAWISFSCRDERSISDGTPIADAAARFRDHDTVLAVGINCTAPQFVTPLIREIRRALPGKAVVVYPNSGERYQARDNSWHGTVTPVDCAAAATEWRAAGAMLIGGCCRMGPDHIAAMKEALRT